MLAILEDAVACFQKYIFVHDARGKTIFAEAERWTMDYGICAEVCPTGSTRHSREFEGACFDPGAMVRRFVLDGAPVPPFKPKKGGEIDPELAKKVEIGKEFMDFFAQPER